MQTQNKRQKRHAAPRGLLCLCSALRRQRQPHSVTGEGHGHGDTHDTQHRLCTGTGYQATPRCVASRRRVAMMNRHWYVPHCPTSSELARRTQARPFDRRCWSPMAPPQLTSFCRQSDPTCCAQPEVSLTAPPSCILLFLSPVPQMACITAHTGTAAVPHSRHRATTSSLPHAKLALLVDTTEASLDFPLARAPLSASAIVLLGHMPRFKMAKHQGRDPGLCAVRSAVPSPPRGLGAALLTSCNMCLGTLGVRGLRRYKTRLANGRRAPSTATCPERGPVPADDREVSLYTSP